MSYVDGFLVPVPASNREAYLAAARVAHWSEEDRAPTRRWAFRRTGARRPTRSKRWCAA